MQREEETMERSQGNRSSAVQQKCGATDIRKSDHGHQRFPRAGKKREQQGSKPDQYNNGRKPLPQRDRAIDKRPKPRGYDNYRERDEVAEGNRAEIGSALQQGSRKANLNHLLNFTFAPREKEGGGWKGRNKWTTRSSRVTYNKEQFLQANCQFIVRDTGDYTLHATCPDRLVDWDLLEQVRIFGHGVPSCPICLFPPTAAKITRCGHIYCWVCILHYLSLGDKPWRKCPICYESIVKKDLKSVVSLDAHQFSIGEEVTMKLMKKEKGSVLVLPKNQWSAGNQKPFPVDANIDTHFSKLLVASVDQVQADIVNTEKQALLQQKEECWDSIEGSFVELALADLAEREESLVATARAKEELAEAMSAVDLVEAEDVPMQAELPAGIAQPKAGIIYTSAFSDEEEDPSDGDNCSSPQAAERAWKDSTVSTESVDSAQGLVPPASLGASSDCSFPTPEEASALLELPLDPEEKTARAQDSAHAFYFYQAADGQHVYMHSINARCLLKQYGSLEHCPDTITARIEALEGISMTQELRQRLRYLNHLPLTCEFRVAELRLKPPLVSRDTLAHFQTEFDKRRQLRQRKARDERRMSRMIEKQEKKQLEPYMNTKIVYSQQVESVIIPSAAPPSPDFSVDSPPSAEILSDSPTSQGSADDPSAPVSFAQMLRAGKAKPDAWPKLPPKNGTPVEPVPKPVARQRHGSESQSEGEDHVPIPTYQSSFGDAIRAALDTIEGDKSKKEDSEVTMEASSPAAQQSGKKKKMKKKLLFSTTMNRTK